MSKEKISTFFDLTTWKLGHEIVLEIYSFSKAFPKEEQFGLTSQMRRAAVSVTSNIAEGFSRRTADAKKQFYYMSLGSSRELQNQAKIAKDLGYIDDTQHKAIQEKLLRFAKMITGLISSAETRPKNTEYRIPNTKYGDLQ